MTTTVVFVSVAWLAAVEPSLQEAPYGVGRWPAAMGNHRARVRVEDNADAVRVHLPWRRRDRNPQEKAIHLVDATDGQRITNVARARIGRESGDLVFQPRNVPGKTLIALASWAPETVDCRLTIDFEALALAPETSRLRAPAVENFQGEAIFRPEDPIAA